MVAAQDRHRAAQDAPARRQRRGRNVTVVAGLLLLVAGMGTLVYYAVPLYRLFCEATGFGGTTQVAQATPTAVVDREITVRFDANVGPGLPWNFVAPKPVTLRLGEERVVAYAGRNIGGTPYLGTATYNVTPVKAGRYFNKIQCFCFTEQLLRPGEAKEFTVSFFVDPKLADDPATLDVSTITLSYTFFDQGTEARDRYLREHKLADASTPTRGDPSQAFRAIARAASNKTARSEEIQAQRQSERQ